jgi:serine O-acetyltransferase
MNRDPLADAHRLLLRQYQQGFGVNGRSARLPTRGSAERICQRLLELLFPGYFANELVAGAALERFLDAQLAGLAQELRDQVANALACVACREAAGHQPTIADSGRIADELLGDLAAVRTLIASDVEAAFHNDPAAVDRETIILSYPFVEALAIQRFAHCLYARGVPLLPRMMTEVAHSRTGIDIHPGASIGPSFFIDHGTGVVIGETCTIGAHCVLYQGVTLGAWNPTAKDGEGELQRGQGNKRHPDLEEHVTVYAGATILGGGTRIGHHSVIGGKVWLTHSVEPHSVVMIDEPKLSIRKRKGADGAAAQLKR